MHHALHVLDAPELDQRTSLPPSTTVFPTVIHKTLLFPGVTIYSHGN